jgi:hypothetical protein
VDEIFRMNVSERNDELERQRRQRQPPTHVLPSTNPTHRRQRPRVRRVL